MNSAHTVEENNHVLALCHQCILNKVSSKNELKGGGRGRNWGIGKVQDRVIQLGTSV